MSETTVYASAAAELRALNQEFIDLGQKSLALALKMGEQLTIDREKFPPRSGWLEFLEEVGINKDSARNYMLIWEKRSILLTVSNITLAEAYRLLRPPKKRGLPLLKVKEQGTRNIAVKTPVDKAVMTMFEGFIMEVQLQHPELTREQIIGIVRNAINT